MLLYIILAVWQYVIVIRVWVRAATAFCLPARCEVGVPPWATASRKCLAILNGGWEPSLLESQEHEN